MSRYFNAYNRSILIIVAVVLTALLFALNIFATEKSKELENEHLHILLINAYHRGYGWTDSQTDGVLATFMANSDDVIISVEYLDWKRYPTELNLENQFELLAYKYRDKQIDVVIATDDIGMQFAIDHRSELFPEAPIVFSGVFEESARKRMGETENITGVIEKIDPFGTMEIIMALHPELEHIYVVNDHSESGVDVEASILEAVEHYSDAYTYEVLNQQTYEELIEQMKKPKPNSVIFMGTYNLDYTGNVIPNELFVQTLSQTSKIPIYTTYEYLFNYGVVGGSLLSGYLQGERAAEMGIDILNGTPIETIPLDTVATVYNGFDYTYLTQYELNMNQLPEIHSMINQPISVYETYKTIILTTLGIMLMMVVFIVVLVINISNRKRTQIELDMEHKELLKTYEALAASEEELLQQNNELLEHQEKITYMANHDYLTELPNRLYIATTSEKLIREARLHNEQLMVLFLDLDKFNYINTSYGHKIGDELLRSVAKRIFECEDIQGEFARIGGDEFIYLENYSDVKDVEAIANNIARQFKKPFNIDGNSISVVATMGYAVYPTDGEKYDDLLSKADTAMYLAKQKGYSSPCRFRVEMNEALVEKIKISQALPIGIRGNEFSVYYQPQYSSAGDEVIGYEALIRWNSYTLGQVHPDRFISVAEKTGDIIELGFYVMKESIIFQREISEVSGKCKKIAINISVVQIQRSTFSDEVIRLFEAEEAKPKCFELEITESVFIHSFDHVNSQLKKLRDYGFSIALDDFGTGYSSLTYLRKLPITTLKIDKSFIDDILTEGENHFLTASIIEIAHQLGYDVVAEGVECQEQLSYLEQCGCEIIQGYLYSKPKPAKVLLEGEK